MDKNSGAVTCQPGGAPELEQKNSGFGNVTDLNVIFDKIDDLTIHQHLDAFEVCMGWERNNRYSIYAQGREQILYIYEAAQCYARQCYGSLRELSLVVTDNEDNKLLQFYRPLRCSSRICYVGCNLQKMEIYLPSKELIGVVNEKWSCCSPQYEVNDDAGDLRFSVEGDFCHFRCCCSICFKIFNAQGDFVSSISSRHGGCPSLIGAFNEFTINYTSSLSPVDKVRILATSFLLDFNYFQRHGKCY